MLLHLNVKQMNRFHICLVCKSLVLLRHLRQYLERQQGAARTQRREFQFPGETEKEFEDTLDLLRIVQYDSIFSFKYSPRPNTPAVVLEDQIPDEEKIKAADCVIDNSGSLQATELQVQQVFAKWQTELRRGK